MKIFCIGVLFLGLAAIIVLSACHPSTLGDENKFLRDFVNHELLNILGIILAITLASAAQIHLKFNELEEREGKPILAESRKEVRSDSFWLIYLFVCAIILVLVKPYVLQYEPAVSIINGLAVWVLLFNVLILYDITDGIFRIPPHLKSDS